MISNMTSKNQAKAKIDSDKTVAPKQKKKERRKEKRKGDRRGAIGQHTYTK